MLRRMHGRPGRARFESRGLGAPDPAASAAQQAPTALLSRLAGTRTARQPGARSADQPWTTNVLALPERLEQDCFSFAVIFRDLTTTALLWPSVPFGAGPVMTSGTNQK